MKSKKLWQIRGVNILGEFSSEPYVDIEKAKQNLMQLRHNGVDGFIWRIS